GSDPIMAYTSTNKVYGTLEGLPLVEKETRWDYPEGSEHYDGITEDQPFDIGGPYGCSKAVGDMYFREYARTYGMRTFVFRMAAIYGELQYATEVHGWVGWFLKRAHEHKPVTIYGDGKQVRGVLHVSDLVRAFEMAINKINRVRGHAFNVGGDRGNSLSIIELLDFMRREFNIAPSEIGYADWRRIDQKCFIANCRKARRYFGWRQRVRKEDGIRRMYNWIRGVS
ncbi:TPA: NAD-dependent epimerase/dehydratase family protein, partial [Candidatus Bathyarchaeota archaeon]|nr:NAD-dependent epimerase/dehydratase family protein [Candidatus Bathyarchaeota archaeon]